MSFYFQNFFKEQCDDDITSNKLSCHHVPCREWRYKNTHINLHPQFLFSNFPKTRFHYQNGLWNELLFSKFDDDITSNKLSYHHAPCKEWRYKNTHINLHPQFFFFKFSKNRFSFSKWVWERAFIFKMWWWHYEQ